MNHRHLLPEEFDLLLDDEVGFGVAPLREHVQGCEQCRARFADARLVADALEALPQLAPSYALADKVMARVPVFVPWHVAARDAAGRWMPRSHAGRVAAVGMMGAVGALVTGGAVWMASRGDLIGVVTEVAGTHLRGTATQVLRDGVVTLFGPGVMDTLQHGGLMGLAAVAAGFLVAATASAFGLRAIATAARRRS